jgi:hypothetical protein
MKYHVATLALLLSILAPLSQTHAEELSLSLQPLCESANSRRVSAAALVLALREKHWIIRGTDLEGGRVMARACRARVCITIDADINLQGGIKMRATRERHGRETSASLPRDWQRHLTTAYDSFSCYDPDRILDLYDQHRYPQFTTASDQ